MLLRITLKIVLVIVWAVLGTMGFATFRTCYPEWLTYETDLKITMFCGAVLVSLAFIALTAITIGVIIKWRD